MPRSPTHPTPATTLGALCVLGAVVVGAGCATSSGPAKSPDPFARYERTPALNAILRTHAEGATDREQRLLLATWFKGGDPRVAMIAGVRPDGRVSTWRYEHEYALTNPRRTDLVDDQLAALREALAALPESQSPPLEDLLIVSFRRDGQWVTRTYDRTAPPEAVAAIFEITGAPIEPAVGR